MLSNTLVGLVEALQVSFRTSAWILLKSQGNRLLLLCVSSPASFVVDKMFRVKKFKGRCYRSSKFSSVLKLVSWRKELTSVNLQEFKCRVQNIQYVLRKDARLMLQLLLSWVARIQRQAGVRWWGELVRVCVRGGDPMVLLLNAYQTSRKCRV